MQEVLQDLVQFVSAHQDFASVLGSVLTGAFLGARCQYQAEKDQVYRKPAIQWVYRGATPAFIAAGAIDTSAKFHTGVFPSAVATDAAIGAVSFEGSRALTHYIMSGSAKEHLQKAYSKLSSVLSHKNEG